MGIVGRRGVARGRAILRNDNASPLTYQPPFRAIFGCLMLAYEHRLAYVLPLLLARLKQQTRIPLNNA